MSRLDKLLEIVNEYVAAHDLSSKHVAHLRQHAVDFDSWYHMRGHVVWCTWDLNFLIRTSHA